MKTPTKTPCVLLVVIGEVQHGEKEGGNEC